MRTRTRIFSDPRGATIWLATGGNEPTRLVISTTVGIWTSVVVEDVYEARRIERRLAATLEEAFPQPRRPVGPWRIDGLGGADGTPANDCHGGAA